MNTQLKFSWGHIVAFLSLIVLSYVTFMGVTYMTDSNFIAASVWMIVIDAVLFVVFIGAQVLKATTRKFAKRIWFERILVFTSPVVFILSMIPLYHFGTVQSQDKEIVTCFTNAISASKQMFDDYGEYSYERISNYEKMLDNVIQNQQSNNNEFTACGFSKGKEYIQKNNMVNTLRLQLVSINYDSLKTEAIKWIDASSKGASTWNVFLLGNTKQIKSAIHEWNTKLTEFANSKMSNEEFNNYNEVKPYSQVNRSLASVDEGLESLTSKFTKREFPSIISIGYSMIIYFALLFPYFLQDRHTKSLFRLIGTEKDRTHSSSFVVNATQSNMTGEEIKTDLDKKKSKVSSRNSENGEDDDFSSFTM